MSGLTRLVPVVALFGLIAGLFYLTMGVYALFNAVLAGSWPEVSGSILSVNDVVVDMALGKPGNATSINSEIRYEYSFEGTYYENDRVHFKGPGAHPPFNYNRSLGDLYHVGDKVKVYVNPLRPNEAVLDRSVWRPIWYCCVGLAFVIVWILYLKYFRRSIINH